MLLLLQSGPGRAIVATAPPVNTAVPVISGSPNIGATLSTTNGTWTGAPAPTYAYQWKRNGSNIGGATSGSYLLISGDYGTTIIVTVTATNTAGAASATSTGVGPIGNVVTYDVMLSASRAGLKSAAVSTASGKTQIISDTGAIS
jgi:hypothetical protein